LVPTKEVLTINLEERKDLNEEVYKNEVKTIKGQIAMNKSLIKDNVDAIASLNLLKVKNS
jgi:hypothetical protein